ncbi:WD domain, G-beta repeat protein (macronuclear) [Tetrahymena thermophila SB210]|uniref:WD domain, G-beta repeat protein n=1 Tax=Tetrahymena thermophila (strain SB210) TaxID=312017 RepID=Q22KH8_TETTS|nr:WD domain, G-beta repeat protein [Tetrahymena thermophila SB210]EAR85821.2 WD domain, G-beta repeat protein [Tetrahymena thermophila SB210]|eukprot:XP_001033484.2 WD domain, G-beta repeat protein [Tetrahymena thermophila SB210]
MDKNENQLSEQSLVKKQKINRLRDLHQVKDLEKDDVDYLIYKIEQFKGDHNTPLIDHYTLDFIMMLIDKDKVNEIERKFKSQGKKGIDIIDFIRILITSIDHKPHETIYITLALIDLFKEISESRGMSTTISFNDFTGFICDYFVEKNITTYLLPTVKMPEQKKFNTNQKQIREIDINPPILFGKTEEGIKRLIPSSIVTDSSKHNNQQITKGVYASGYRRIITLDSLSTNLKVFKLNSIFERTIVPQRQKDKEVIIMGFTYSDREQRIGATLKDVSLIFWDKQDMFKFQKGFSISAFVSDYQTNIWYLNSTQQWITTDKTNSINIWDLEKEKLKQQIQSKEITGSINEIVEITHIKLVAVSSLDKKVTVWDLEKENIIFTIDLGHAGIHHLLYHYQYQCLITSGFENSINVYSVNPQYLDYDSLGKLVGHNSMVTAVQIIDKTPMVVSADDMGNIKIWDIRSLKCLQTINIGFKTTMTHIVNVPDKNMICLLGTRVNFISFDNSNIQKANEDIYPIKVEFNMMKQEMSICTRKDMRFLRMKDGKITKIFTGLLQNQDDEIATCSSINQFKNFILGDHRGGLALYSYNNGERLKDLVGHQSEVSQLKIDFPNKLIISSSWDNTVMIQRETPSGAEIKRIIKNAHYNKEVNQMEVSLFHNIIVTGSSGRKVFIWDYEFVKLIACIEIDKGTEPTGFFFINGYRVLIITTNSGMIYILKFNVKELKAQFELIGYFNISNYLENENNKKFSDRLQNKDTEEYEEEKSDILIQNKNVFQSRRESSFTNPQNINNNISNANQNTNTFSGQNKNTMVNSQFSTAVQANIDQIQLNSSQSQQNQNKNQQTSTFAQDKKKKIANKPIPQNIKVGFSIQGLEKSNSQQMPIEKQASQIPLNPQQNQKSIFRQTNDSQFFSSDTFQKEKRKVSVSPKNNLDLSNDSSLFEADLPQEWVTKLLTEIQVDEETKCLSNCLLYAATNKGNIIIFNIDSIIQNEDVRMSDHSVQRLNYNPLRQCTEDFYSQIEQITKESVKLPLIVQQNKKNFSQKEKKVVKNLHFCAHRDVLTSFQFVEMSQKCIVTSSQDQYVRIWTLDGQLIGNLNINHPLPIKWDVLIDQHEKVKKKVFYAFKILDIMLSKYKSDQQLRKLMQIDGFINNLLPPQKDSIKLNFSEIKDTYISALKDQTKGVKFMRDEYSPRDLKYDEIKQLFEKELRGISLKQMEANKRLLMAQQQADEQYQAPEIDIHAKRRKYEEHEMLQFLAPNWRNRLLQKQIEQDLHKNVYFLGKKLDQKIRDKLKNQNKTRFSTMNFQGDIIPSQEEINPNFQQSRNSNASNAIINTPKLDARVSSTSKQINRYSVSPRKNDDQNKSKQDIQSNQFISIIEKEETPSKTKKGSKLNIQINNDVAGNSSDLQFQQLINQQEKEKKQQVMSKKKKKNVNRSMDYLEYASEKNYLDESILNMNSQQIGSLAHNVVNTRASYASNNNSIQRNNSNLYFNQSLQTDPANNSVAIQQSSIISKNANNSTLASEKSILLNHSISANNLQKAKIQLFMKNINSKLRQSKYQPEKMFTDRYEKQLTKEKQNQIDEQEQSQANNENKEFLDSIISEALQDVQKNQDNLGSRLSQNSSPQLFAIKKHSLSLIKPLQLQSKTLLDSLREETLNLGSQTDRPQHQNSQKQFQLKLPSIQSGLSTFRGENDVLITSIRSGKFKKINKL